MLPLIITIVVIYLVIASAFFGVEMYIKNNDPASPFEDYGADGEQTAGMVTLAIFWPICSPFYFGYYLAQKLGHDDT